ncbi:MAG: hypothetical protein HY928_12385 [Elusimicrobia bacterium]|nr:hypothetical protein [Elusimicrobiota bacterium]
MKRPGGLLPVIVLAGLAFAAYVPSLSGDFLLDDRVYLLENPNAGPAGSWLAPFTSGSALVASPDLAGQRYRPLTALAYKALFAVSGRNPFGFHLASLSVHALNAVLVFLLAEALLGAGPAPWAAALLFCLHPAQPESVSYIANLSSLLAAAFMLGALLLHERGKALPALACFAAALLCRESAAALPLWAAAWDRLRGRPVLRGLAPYAAVFAAYFVLRAAILGGVSQYRPWGGSWGSHAVYAVHGLFEDLKIAFWPAGLRISYSFAPAPAAAAAKAAALLALAAAALELLRRRSPFGLGLCLALAALAPVANLLPMESLAAVGYLYAPLAGLFAAAFAARLRPGALAVLAAGAVALSGFCIERQLDWAGGFQLDLAAYAAAPEDPSTGLNLASHYFNWRMFGRAAALAEPASSPTAPEHLRAPARRLAELISTAR